MWPSSQFPGYLVNFNEEILKIIHFLCSDTNKFRPPSNNVDNLVTTGEKMFKKGKKHRETQSKRNIDLCGGVKKEAFSSNYFKFSEQKSLLAKVKYRTYFSENDWLQR